MREDIVFLSLVLEAEAQVTPAPIGADVPARRSLLWLWILVSTLGLAGGLGGLAWYLGWIMP